jgi:AAA domain
MSGVAYQRVLDTLRHHNHKVRESGGKAKAQCPAHDDSDPSLSIRSVEGQALIYCWGGCNTSDVLAALSLTMSDLYDNPRGATYTYDDGRTVHRTPDKQFRQSGNTNGHQPQLYRLSKVQAAFFNDKIIWLVEGEKDVHAIESLGEVATTAPMGAKNFHKVDVSPLAGAKVKAIADNDDAGRGWQQQVAEKLDGVAASLEFYQAKTGKNAADHIAAGHTLDELEPIELKEARRKIRLTRASTIKPRPVRWAWTDRIPAGELALTPGRGGLGKSTFHAWMIAHLTRGTLPGVHFGTPKPCIIAASEDSWERTIVPRLIAAGADTDLVYRVDVITEADEVVAISLPLDIVGLAEEIKQTCAALLSIDPVISVLSGALDTHKDGEVRQALEPLGRLADQTGCSVLGNAHFNKSAGNDPLSLIMGSAAFGNVARAALGFARDTEAEDESCVISQVKNNLGRLNLPSLRYRIDSVTIDTEEGPAEVGKLVMLGESDRSVADILRDRGTRDDNDGHRDIDVWLTALLANGPMESNDIYRAADAAGYSKDQTKGAKKRLGVLATHPDIKGPWFWEMPQGSTQGSQESGDSKTGSLAPLGAPLDDGAPDDDLCPDCAQPFAQPNPHCSLAEYHGEEETL